MEVAELRVVAAAAEEVELVLVDGQPEAVARLGQAAVAPLLPLVALEAVGVHGLRRRVLTAWGRVSSGPKKA